MLPIDIEFGVRTPDLTASTTSNYVEKLCERWELAYKTAQKVNQEECEYSKKQYDCNFHCSKLLPSNMNLVRPKGL